MSISLPQIIIILLIVVLLFGTKRLPNMMEDVAKGIKAFNKGLKSDSTEEKKKTTTKKVKKDK